MEPIKTFWLEPTRRVRRSLRRYSSSEGSSYDCAGGYHTASSDLPNTFAAKFTEHDGRRSVTNNFREPSHDDKRWPTMCERGCGYEFKPEDKWQANVDLLYRRADTGDEMTLREAGPGATYDAWWFSRKGPDGISYAVICPGRSYPWLVDDRASNCGRPDDDVHYCWVRHGHPPDCAVTVDKNGDTCAAGAGSILIGDWHGFLQGGFLVQA